MSITGYNPSASLPADSSGYVELNCTCTGLGCIAFGYSIEIQAGASGSTSNRKLTRVGGTETLNYGLYKDVLRTTPWDIGSHAQGGTVLLSGLGVPVRVTVYGRIPAGQLVPTGNYKESPVVAIIY